jgi:hypothetical protein
MPKKFTRYPRQWHEDFARTSALEAKRLISRANACDDYSLQALIDANRNIAQARVHLSSIGVQSGSAPNRTQKLWRMVTKIDRAVSAADKRVMKRCKILKGQR